MNSKEEIVKIEDVNIRYAKMKQYYLNEIKELNKQAYKFYMDKKFELSEYYIVKELWKSEIWKKAKHIHMELNIFTYGALTCQYCKQEIEELLLRNFQLHHKNAKYRWATLFAPEEVILIHKTCHKKLHNDLKKNNNRMKKVIIENE